MSLSDGRIIFSFTKLKLILYLCEEVNQVPIDKSCTIQMALQDDFVLSLIYQEIHHFQCFPEGNSMIRAQYSDANDFETMY